MTVLVKFGGEYFNPAQIVTIRPHNDGEGTKVVFAVVDPQANSYTRAYSLIWETTPIAKWIEWLTSAERIVIDELFANPSEFR